MSWRAIYNTSTGALVSVGTVVADPLPAGLALVDVGEQPPVGDWDPAQKKFTQPAPVYVWTSLEFLQRFTTMERLGIRAAAKTNGVVEDFLALLDAANEVHSDHVATQQGLGYLASLGLLTPARVAEILGS